MHMAHVEQFRPGAGVLVVQVSTVGDKDERCWADAENKLDSSSTFMVRANFGPGSAVVSTPWTTAETPQDDNRPNKLRRDVSVQMPYFHLADGARSTDASLLLEIILKGNCLEHTDSVSRPGDNEYGGHTSVDPSQIANARREGGRVRVSPPHSPSTTVLADATLDVQTALVANFSQSNVSGAGPTECIIPFNVVKKSVRGKAVFPCVGISESIPMAVTLKFISTNCNAATPGDQRVERAIQPSGEEHTVPVFFVVLTTLFDCATAMNGAELRLYTRCRDTGLLSALFSRGRGAIAMHESFEWNISADLRTLFPASLNSTSKSSPVRQGKSLVVALVDTIPDGSESRARCRRSAVANEEGITVGVLEMSLNDVASCGIAGQWYPLRAFSGSIHHGTALDPLNSRHKHTERGVVGETLVAFAWMQQGQATDAIPNPLQHRIRGGKFRGRARRKHAGMDRSLDKASSNHGSDDGMDHANNLCTMHIGQGNVNISNSNRDPTNQEVLVHLHVWDALLPLDWPESAFYFTVRLSCRGSRVHRVSTKPARGKGGLRMNTTRDERSNLCFHGTGPNEGGNIRAGSIHVIWDEHLVLSVKHHAVEDTVVELLLRDASVDDGTILAAREVEPFQAFIERNSLAGLEIPTDETNRCSSSSVSHLKLPGPVVYRLRIQHTHGKHEEGELTSSPLSKDKATQGGCAGFRGVEVRMAGLVNPEVDTMEDFLRRKADVARIPGAVERSLSTIGGGRSPGFSTLPFPLTQGIRHRKRPRRLLDLSAAGGLFRSFADGDVCGIPQGKRKAKPDCCSPENQESMEQCQSPTEAMISDNGLHLVAQQYFPRLTHERKTVGVDEPSDGCHSSPATIRQTNAFKFFGRSIDFADFVSWLRSLPQEDLGAAGLLVSPRTALHNISNLMREDTRNEQEIATMLEQARLPTNALVGGWCSVVLESTMDAVAMDRVRIGWGQEVGGYSDENGNGDRHKNVESSWRRHTKMLQRDITVLDEALTEVEHMCTMSSLSATKEGNSTDVPSDVQRDICDVAGSMPGTTAEFEVTKNFERTPQADRPISTESEGASVCAEESACSLVVALYLLEKVALLESAAQHLSEALRCASDAMHSNSTRGRDTRFAQFERILAQPGTKNNCDISGRDNALLEAKYGICAPGDPRCRSRHGLLLQHIKMVKVCQFEVGTLRRRCASVIARRSCKEPISASNDGLETSYHGDGTRRDAEFTQSPLALIKRIRRAQNAAHRPQSLNPSSSACDGVATDRNVFRVTRDHPSSDRLLPPKVESGDSMTGENDEDAGGPLLSQEADSWLSMKDPLGAALCQEENGATSTKCPRSPVSSRAPFGDILWGAHALRNIRSRLESLRAGFHERGVELPAGFASTTTERILEIARGGSQDIAQTNTLRSRPSAALCCPIDRFVLHVFVHAGTTAECGSEMFTTMQEIIGIGGLDTHAPGSSLWTTASQAGVVSVDRWIVAAVLRQVTDAVAATNDHGIRCAQMSFQKTTNDATAATIAAGLEDHTPRFAPATEHARMSTQATPSRVDHTEHELTSALCGNTTRRHAYLMSPRNPASLASTSQDERPGLSIITGKTGDDEGCLDQRPQDRYAAIQSASDSFDIALVGALLIVAQGNARVRFTAAGALGEEKTGNKNSDMTENLSCVECTLLHNFVIAGFADESGLDVLDVVEAVNARRKKLRLAAAAMVSGAPYRRVGDGGNTLTNTDKTQFCLGGPRGIEGFPEGNRLCVRNLDTPGRGNSTNELRAVHAVDGEASVSDGGADTSGETEIDSRRLDGIPTELQELFRTAALAREKRDKQKQQQQQVGQGNDVGAAERKILNILDSNRTLESAPFSDGKTALHHAAAWGDDFLVRVLLQRGCKPHLKDFGGRRACDLTRDLECLRLLGALKKACETSAFPLRNVHRDVVAANVGKKDGIPEATRSARAMMSVDFAVSFRLAKELAIQGMLDDPVRSDHHNGTSNQEQGGEGGEEEEERLAIAADGGQWVDGIARSYDVKNKILYIDTVEPLDSASMIVDTPSHPTTPSTPKAETIISAPSSRAQTEKEMPRGPTGTKGGVRRRGCARHVLDVRLLSNSSPEGEELFDQLRAFSHAFKINIARVSLDIAVSAAADLGAMCRRILGDIIVDMINESVATQVIREQRLAVAAERTATAAIGNVMKSAITRARYCTSMAKYRPGQVMPATTDSGTEILHNPTSPIISSSQMAENDTGDNMPRQKAALVEKGVAARMSFQCTTIVTERRRKASRNAPAGAISGVGIGGTRDLGSIIVDSKRRDMQYLARWTLQNGLSTVVVRGVSYLNAVAGETGKGNGSKQINLEGRDMGIRRVLDLHGVSLSACLHTFDVMQDMEDPKVVLEMMAAGICQLSTKFREEGIDFSSLRQSEQNALKAEVLSQLYHETDHTACAAPEWDELTMTMEAYGGVTSVGLVRRVSHCNDPRAGGKQELMVSAPTGKGWLSPEEAAAAMAAPRPKDSVPSMSSSSVSLEPLPQSAIRLVLTLMRCNPSEVLGSLSPGIGVDGRNALIGRVDYSGRAGSTSAVGMTGGGKGDRDVGHYDSKIFLQKRDCKDRGRVEVCDEDEADNCCTFRCSLDVAWDKDKGGVFVQRFGFVPNKETPSFTLRAVGIRGFSIAQLPVTLEDIDDVWDQAGIDEASVSGSDVSTIRGHPRGSGSPSASLHSSERRAEHSARSERSVALSGKSLSRTLSAEHSESSTRSEKSTSTTARESSRAVPMANLTLASGATSSPDLVENLETLERSEPKAVAAASDQSLKLRESGEDDLRNSSRVGDDGRSQEGEGTTFANAIASDCAEQNEMIAVPPRDICDNRVVVDADEQYIAAEVDTSAPSQKRYGVECGRHAGEEEIRLKEEPATVTRQNDDPVTGVQEEPTQQQLQQQQQQEEEEGKEVMHEGCKEDEALETKKEVNGNKVDEERTDEQLTIDGTTGPLGSVASDSGTIIRDANHADSRESGERPPGITKHELNQDAACEGVLGGAKEPVVYRNLELSENSQDQGLVPLSLLSDPDGPSNRTSQAVEHGSEGRDEEDVALPSQNGDGKWNPHDEVIGDGSSTTRTQSSMGVATIMPTPCGEKHASDKELSAKAKISEGVTRTPDADSEIALHRAPDPGLLCPNNEAVVERVTREHGSTDASCGSRGAGMQDGYPGRDVGRYPSQRERVTSQSRVESVRTDGAKQVDSATLDVTTPQREESEQTLTGTLGTRNSDRDADSHLPLSHDPHSLDQEQAQRPLHEHQQNVFDGDSVLNHTPGIAAGNAETKEATIDTAPAEAHGALSREGDLDGKKAVDNTNSTTRLLTPVWPFPPTFVALATLYTTNETIQCTVEGQISLKEKSNYTVSGEEGAIATPGAADAAKDVGGTWNRLYCMYRFAAKENGSDDIRPVADIDLEDDAAQTRLENLLGQSYGLSMDDVLARFSPDTDLSSGDAVVRSFTDSICQLRPSIRRQLQSTKGVDGEGGGEEAVYTAVEAALRGIRGDSDWRELLVWVSGSSVLEVGIITSSSQDTVGIEAICNRGSTAKYSKANPAYPYSGVAIDNLVDCSNVPSTSALRPHLIAGGVPLSGVNVLERTGFFRDGSVVDLADVLAALAQEAKRRYAVGIDPNAAPPSLETGKGEEVMDWPGVDPGRRQVLRLLHEGNSGDLTPTRECTVTVEGTREDMKLKISPVICEDGCSPVVGDLTLDVSHIRRQTSKLVTEGALHAGEKALGSENDNTTGKPEVEPTNTTGLQAGDRIEARFGGKSEWFAGVVRAINDIDSSDTSANGHGDVDGTGSQGSRHAVKSKLPTVAVDYDDGDVEERVPRVRVRLPGQKQPRLLKEGDEVDVRRGKIISLARVVVRPSSALKEGHYDLRLLDDGRRRGGDLIESCPRSAIMAMHGWPPARS